MANKTCDEYIKSAEDFLTKCDWDSAIIAYSKCIKLYEDCKTCSNVSICKIQTKSTATPTACNAKSDEIAKAYNGRGYARCFNAKNNNKILEKSIEDFYAALELTAPDTKNYYHILRQRAYAYYRKGQYDKVLIDCKNIIESKNSDLADKSFAYEIRGSVYNEIEQKDKSIYDYHEAILQNQNSFSLIERYREACESVCHD